MSNNVTFSTGAGATPPNGTIVETQDQGGAVERQVVAPGPYAYTPLSGSQYGLTIDTAKTLTVPSGATYAALDLEGAAARFTMDGLTTPTTSSGRNLASGSAVGLIGPTALANFKIIGVVSGGKINVEYFK